MARSEKPIKNLTFTNKLNEILATKGTLREVKDLIVRNGIYTDYRQIKTWTDGLASPAEWHAIVPLLAAYFDEPIHSFVCPINKRGIYEPNAEHSQEEGPSMEPYTPLRITGEDNNVDG